MRKLLLACAILAVTALVIRYPGHDDWRVCAAIVAATAAGLLWLSLTRMAARSSIGWLGSALSDATCRDVRSIGFLAEALDHPQPDVVMQAESALLMLLPQLRADQGDLLSPGQRERLYNTLVIRNISSKSDLIAAAVNALERIGDTRALPAVSALAACPLDSSSCRRVKTAAEACVKTLREIEASHDPNKTLLRPSEAALNTTDTLLRPVGQDESCTLVRPTTVQSGNQNDG